MRRLFFLAFAALSGSSPALAQYNGYDDYRRQTEIYNQQRDLEYQQDKMRERQIEDEHNMRMRQLDMDARRRLPGHDYSDY